MMEKINRALNSYWDKWQALIDKRADKEFFDNLKPTAIGWKVADRKEYDRCYDQLHDHCDKIVETWMNGRWIAKMHLRDSKLNGDIEIIKLMQRRPGSNDAPGLDHVDFYSPKVKGAEAILNKEPNLKWTHETNDVMDNYDWISIWFADTEAKLKTNTVIDIIIGELKELNHKIIHRT